MRRDLINIIVFVSIILTGCKSKEIFVCGLASSIKVIPNLHINGVQNYINSITKNPCDTIIYIENIRYSDDRKYFINYNSIDDKNKPKGILYNIEGKLISKFNNLEINEKAIWFRDFLILDGYSYPNPEKTIVSFKSGTKKKLKSKHWFQYIGKDDNKAFFISTSFDNRIGLNWIKDFHSIISIDKKKVELVKSNDCLDFRWLRKNYNNLGLHIEYFSNDTLYHYEYFDNKYLIRTLRKDKFIDEDSIIEAGILLNNNILSRLNDFKNIFDTDIYSNDERKFIKITDTEIYELKEDSIEMIFDFNDIVNEFGFGSWIREYRIEKEFLIFNIQASSLDLYFQNEDLPKTRITKNGLESPTSIYGYHTIGIINLKTNEIYYPEIQIIKHKQQPSTKK